MLFFILLYVTINKKRMSVRISYMKEPMRNKTEIAAPLLQWYDSHARILPWRGHPSSYAVWISEIMLQQTRVEAVIPYFDRWMRALPDLPALANASEEEVLKLWEGLGYYSRVRNLHKAAKIVMEKYGGCLPASFEALRNLPGIGEYTAGSVGSIAFQLPVPCVDGNVLRVVTRLTADKSDIGAAAVRKRLTEWVREIIPKDRPGDFNQAMMELGATVCLPSGLPKCEVCPVAFLCEARIQDCATEFPVKSEKPARKVEKKTVLILLNGAAPGTGCGTGCGIALRKRTEAGLLSGLWEFPNLDGHHSENEIRKLMVSLRLNPSSLVRLKKSKHIFSHIEWDMIGYLAVLGCDAPARFTPDTPFDTAAEDISQYRTLPDFCWIGVERLDEQLALPAAFKSYYQIMKRYIAEGVVE
jgi:A/G-specific adenine glycosylase